MLKMLKMLEMLKMLYIFVGVAVVGLMCGGVDGLCDGLKENKTSQARLQGFFSRMPNTLIRPLNNITEHVKVNMTILEVRFLDFDDVSNHMVTELFIKLNWIDDTVTWNPSDYDNVDHVIVNDKTIWTPPFSELISTDNFSRTRLIFRPKVYANGTVNQIINIKIQSSCLMDLTDYPFDRQKCVLNIECHYTAGYYLTPVPNNVYKFMNSEWKMREASFVPNKMFDYAPGAYMALICSVVMDRVPHVYHYFVIIPSIIITFFILAIFCLPIHSKQRFTLCMFLLMSILILSSTIYSLLPTGSAKVPLIVRYLFFELIFLSLTYACILFSHNIYNNYDNLNNQVPQILQKIFFNPVLIYLTSSTLPSILLTIQTTPNNTNKSSGNGGSGGGLKDVLKQLNNYLSDKLEQDVDTTSYANQWKQLAYIFERLVFLMLFIVFIITTTVIFATKYVDRYRSFHYLFE